MPEWDLFLRKASEKLPSNPLATSERDASLARRRLTMRAKRAFQAGSIVMGILASSVVMKGYQRPIQEWYFDATLQSLDASSNSIWNQTSVTPEEGFMQLVSESFPSGFQTYEIQKGDTLEKIARQFGMSIDGLFYINRVPKAIIEGTEKRPIIRSGRMMIIPGSHHELELSKPFLRAAYLRSVDAWSHAVQFTSFFPSTQSHLWWDTILTAYKKTYESQLLAWQRLGYREYAHIPWTPQISDYDDLIVRGGHIQDTRLPRALDIRQQRDTNCAGAIRAIMQQSVDPYRMPKAWQLFFSDQNIDAWKFWDRLMSLGFQQKHANLMDYFDERRLTSYDPLRPDVRDAYYREVNAMYASLREYWPGVIIPKFFKFSRYKSHMAKEARSQKSKWASEHYNTHQTVYVGESEMSLRWADVPRLPNSQVLTGDRSVDIWLTDFIITRLDFGGSRVSSQVYEETRENLLAMAPLVTLTIGDGQTLSLSELLKAPTLPVISDEAIVRIEWPLLLDGEHQDASEILGHAPLRGYHAERDGKMTIRMRFAWEYGMYLPTEALVPPKGTADFPLFSVDAWQKISSMLTVGWVYDIRKASGSWYTHPYPAEYAESCDIYERVPRDENLYDGMWKYFCRSSEYRHFSSPDQAKQHFDQSIYPAQIQALQMLGILPYGEQRARIVANRVIPFITTPPTQIRQEYQRFIGDTMQQWQHTNSQLPISQTYVGVYSLPGVSDTWERITTHIVSYLEKAPGGQFLAQRLGQLDHASRRQFMETLMTLEGWTPEKKGEFFAQRMAAWTLLVFHRELIRSALDRIERVSASTHYDPVLHRVIHLTSQDERIREIIVRIARSENTPYRDTPTCLSEEPFNALYRCFISRESVKRYVQDIDNSIIGSLRGDYTTSSIGDLQIRFDLIEQWSKKPQADWKDLTWPTREVLRQAITHGRWADNMGIRDTLHERDKRAFDDDMARLHTLSSLIQLERPDQLQRKELYRTLRQLIRLTEHSTDGILGIMVSVPLLEDKIRGHIVHLSGVFRVLGRATELTDTLGNTLPWRPSYTDYERMIVMINNQGETNVMYFMAQVYLQRLYSALTWAHYEYPSIAGKTLKQELLGQTDYHPGAARRHMEGVLSLLESRAQFMQQYPHLLRSELHPQGMLAVSEDENYLRETLDRILRTRGLQDGIYAFMRDERLRAMLTSRSMSDAIIPMQQELAQASERHHNDGFERQFLHYARKGEMP